MEPMHFNNKKCDKKTKTAENMFISSDNKD